MELLKMCVLSAMGFGMAFFLGAFAGWFILRTVRESRREREWNELYSEFERAMEDADGYVQHGHYRNANKALERACLIRARLEALVVQRR